MTAVDKDRLIAAKASSHQWEVSTESDPRNYAVTTVKLPRPKHGYLIAGEITECDDAEHIVRLHNRMPLYDKLVDSVRQCIDQSLENGHGIPLYGVWMYECLAALDLNDE